MEKGVAPLLHNGAAQHHHPNPTIRPWIPQAANESSAALVPP